MLLHKCIFKNITSYVCKESKTLERSLHKRVATYYYLSKLGNFCSYNYFQNMEQLRRLEPNFKKPISELDISN